MNSVLAIDLGATSGRAILGKIEERKFLLQEIHRFDGYMINQGGNIFWDIEKIFSEIKSAISIAYRIDYSFESIGIDPWGVDFGLIDGSGNIIKNPRCYRDTYTKAALEEVTNTIGIDELYRCTGIQTLGINTLFQLVAQKNEGYIENCNKFLMIPDLLNYMLTGEIASEISIASTTQLLDPYIDSWSKELYQKLFLPESMFPNIVPTGNNLGLMKKEIADDIGMQPKKVINIAAHDTACAAYAVPDKDNSYFLSSGTWSLLGVQLDKPEINLDTMKAGFSNEKGAGGKTLLLKNLTGLWLVEQARQFYKAQGETYSYAQIGDMVDSLKHLGLCFFDTDLPSLSEPGDIPLKIQTFCKNTNQKIPQKPAEIFTSIYENLAYKYRYVAEQLEQGTQRKNFYIVGGGSKADILCQYTANALGMNVRAGLSETTALGNIMIQIEALKLCGKSELRGMTESEFKEYKPEEKNLWEENFEKYKHKLEECHHELS